MLTPCYSSYDDALDAIAVYGIALENGNTNHAPMVAEALCALGRPEMVMPWLARYRDRMRPRAAPGQPIRSDDWREALGQRERFTDWALFFQNEIEHAAWPTVLDHWVERLAPGFCAAATHGVIRVGHAVRGLAEAATPNRRCELADALASWAATWQRLPEDNRRLPEILAPREAIMRVPTVPSDQRRPGNIVAALAILEDMPWFAPIIGWVASEGPVASQIAEMTELFARVYLANARDIPTTIAFIHAVTSLAALGHIVPHISEGTARTALRYAWQSGCALYACYGSSTVFSEAVEHCEKSERQLIDRAVENGDEHVIKFTEACLGRYAIAASVVYYAAIDHVAGMIRPRQRANS
jgi:Questin oxidase-like